MVFQSSLPKLLITGASGFLGWHLCQMAVATWDVYGTYHTHPHPLAGVKTLPVNLTDFQAVQQLVNDLQPSAVIHAAAQSQPNICQTDPVAAYAINVMAAQNLAGLCADAAIPFAFTSTDLVFDGLNPPYRETDPLCPVNRYGEQKAIAETRILERHPTAAICRMPLMFGSAPTAPSFLQGFLQTLRQGAALRLFCDEFRTPVSGRDAAAGLLLALKSVQGRIHLGGRERLSRYEFGLLMAQAFQLNQATLSPCHQADVPMSAPRPPDVSLDSTLAFSLGYSPGLVKDELAALSALG